MDETREYSSPPCFMHELEEWDAVRDWRKARRAELIERRMARDEHARRATNRLIVERVLEAVDLAKYPVLGFYWPIRGEIDMRELARRHRAKGGQVALPVIVKKNAPVEFWTWRPGVALQRGLWNIPVPREREAVIPDALIVPLVGFDEACYRLGYGGGYYDRTLAAASPRPFTIGVAHAEAKLPTIRPQPHDIPMDLIVTDRFTLANAPPK
jgi:5,10-methenyltetrahydrofolate synthetase